MIFNGSLVHPPLSKELAGLIVSKAEQVSGIRVDSAKTDFVRLRVAGRLAALGLDDFESYNLYLANDATGKELKKLVEALATHTTSFFRERRHYDWMARDGLDEIYSKRPNHCITVWSAAASLGAELYTAGMVLTEYQDKQKMPLNWSLIGTDISDRILKRAISATYSAEEIEGMDDARLSRFFLRSKRKTDSSQRPLYRLVPELRNKAQFLQANLQNANGLDGIKADIAFLRNVLIYFEPAKQKQVVQNVVSRIRPGGFLLTGHSETVSLAGKLEQIKPTIYRRI